MEEQTVLAADCFSFSFKCVKCDTRDILRTTKRKNENECDKHEIIFISKFKQMVAHSVRKHEQQQ